MRKIDDYLKLNLSFYQTNQENEDNKTIPTVFPNIKYSAGYSRKSGNISNSKFEFYNIFREKVRKFMPNNSKNFLISIILVNNFSIIIQKFPLIPNFTTKFLIQKKTNCDNTYKTGSYYRFSNFRCFHETPFKIKIIQVD